MAEISNTTEVYKVSSGVSQKCPACSEFLEGRPFWERSVNHVLGHGWRLLHVGSEAEHDNDGKTIHFTVAVLGKQ
jgi:hypothetical protein